MSSTPTILPLSMMDMDGHSAPASGIKPRSGHLGMALSGLTTTCPERRFHSLLVDQ